MKKRIISLILVVALMFLTLTGCSFNYAKSDVTKYATLSGDFKEALKSLEIEDGTFGTDEAIRWVKVEDAIATAILGVTDKEDEQFAGKPDKYDSFAFCYYAICTDKDGNKTVIYTNKMEESKATSIQLGLSSLEKFNKAVSDAILNSDKDAFNFYNTSSDTVAGEKDVISVTYTKTEKGQIAGETFEYESITVGGEKGSFAQWLVGKKIGVNLGETVEITEGTGDDAKTYVYSDIIINSELKNNSSSDKVEANDTVFVTYVATINYTYNGTSDEKVSISIDGYTAKDGKYVKTVSTYPELIENITADADGAEKTFAGQLIGKFAGASNSASIKANEQVEITITEGDNKEVKTETVEVEYTSVKVNWIVNSDMSDAIEINDYKPTESTATDIYGNTVKLSENDITYYVYPVSYLPVENVKVEVSEDGTVSASVSAETIIREFYSAVASTEIEEHDHEAEGDHDHEEMTKFVFSTLEGGQFKNTKLDKSLETLVEELVELYSAHSTNEKTLDTEISDLKTAQENLAKDTSEEGSSGKEALVTKVTNARKDYDTAKEAADKSQENVDDKIAEILACVNGDEKLDAPLAADYAKYQYDTLEESYKSDIKSKLAKAVYDLATDEKLAYVTYKELPKSAVKEAYNAIMNTYKHEFYEGTVSSSSSSSSSETNYDKYDGDFKEYFKNAVKTDASMSEVPSYDEAKAYVQSEAENTVKEILLIYLLAEEFGQQLTKEEIKDYKKSYKNMEAMYEQYAYLGLSLTYTLDDYINAKQFDKVFDYLLEEDENNTENKVKYPNLGGDYTFESDEEAEEE